MENQENLMQKLDAEFYSKLTKEKQLLILSNLYEFYDYAPYKTNLSLNDYFYKNFNWLNNINLYFYKNIYQLIVNFYFEPFFFFRPQIEQTLADFWFICFFWEWSLFFDNRVFDSTLVWNDPNAIVPDLSHLKHVNELKAGLKIIWTIRNYKEVNFFSYYLDFSDIQSFVFDKNFFSVWNYWVGASHELNIFGSENMTGLINFLWEKLYTPGVNFDSKYQRLVKGYDIFPTRLLRFGFFPDATMFIGHMNPGYDWITTGYNWFFHFGENYLDSNLSLELVRFQISENYWGNFENIVEDYFPHQSVYFSDNLLALRLPLILLLAKNDYKSEKDLALFMLDYNTVFKFTAFKTFGTLSAETLFTLEPTQWLKYLHDIQSVDQKFFSQERLINLFFGYNSSNSLVNQPAWLAPLTSISQFYSTLRFDAAEITYIEELAQKLTVYTNSDNYAFTAKPSIYFALQQPQAINSLILYLNEKYFDDGGYFKSAHQRTDNFYSFSTFNWQNNFYLFYSEVLPAPHYTWRISVLNWVIFELNLVNFKDYLDTLLKFKELLPEIFTLSFTTKFSDPLFVLVTHGWIIHSLSSYITNSVLTFWVDLYKLFKFFKDLYGPTRFDFFFLHLIEEIKCNLNYFSNWYQITAKTFAQSIYITLIKSLPDNIFSFPLMFYYSLLHSDNYFIKIIFEYINIFYYSMFTYSIPICYIDIYYFQKPNLIVTSLKSMNFTTKPLPIEFYFPFLFIFTNDQAIIRIFTNPQFIMQPTFLDGKPVSVNNFTEIQDFISTLAVVRVNNLENSFRKTDKLVQILNSTNFNNKKVDWLEYDRYINYVVKKNCYKRI
jgi:hypothetical protein